MATITLAEAQAKLPELVRQLAPGEEVAITDGDATVATLSAKSPPSTPTPYRPLIRQRHRDAIPACYLGGALGIVVAWATDASPLLGFGICFATAVLSIAVVFAFARFEDDRDDR